MNITSTKNASSAQQPANQALTRKQISIISMSGCSNFQRVHGPLSDQAWDYRQIKSFGKMLKNQYEAPHLCSPADRKTPGQVASKEKSTLFPHVFEHFNLTKTFLRLPMRRVCSHISSALSNNTIPFFYLSDHMFL